ncbi:MAG: phospholipid carrier-dependent glycosyltransferase [Gammaproteobacteria bacterium]|nr:MAG: phospholipid carrier-dependent glycosyltransferase [Gammaproteobacteria bacterium]
MRRSAIASKWPLSVWALLCVCVAALSVRVWGTWYGLPYSYHADEYHEVMRALQLGTGGFNLDRTGKGGFYFLLFAEYGFYFVALKLLGIVDTAKDFGVLFVRDPSVFYLMGRLSAALLGVLTVAAVADIGRRAFSANAGLLAALFLAVNVLHVDLSRVIGVDVPMTFLATITLCFGMRIIANGRRADYLGAGLFAGLATTTKLPAVLLLVPLLIAHGYAVRQSGGGVRAWVTSSELWQTALAFAGVLVLTNPLFFGNLLDSVAWLFFAPGSGDTAALSAVESGPEVLGRQRPNLYLYYLSVMRESMGWPLFLLGIGGSLLAIWRRRPVDVMLLSYAIIHYLAVASTSSATLYYPRYVLPVIVVMAVLSGRALAELHGVFMRMSVALAMVVALAFVVVPVEHLLDNARILMQEDIRTTAKQWFETHVPSGRRVLIEGDKIGADRQTVRLHDTADGLRRRINDWRLREPKQAKYLEYQLAAHEGGGYDLVLIQDGSTATLDDYLAEGVEYFVIRPLALANLRKGGRPDLDLLESLRTDPRVELIRRFEGGERGRLGSIVEVYQRCDLAAMACSDASP